MTAVAAQPTVHPVPTARAVRGWAVAVTVYLAAVFHRTSLGVAGLQAAERFGITPAQLSVFVLVQLGVYAAMQVPTGVLVDRFGPRRLLIAAASTMALAQLLFAIAPSYPVALLARAVLGCGDALTFVSVLRFAAVHFAPRHFPVVVAATGMLGSAGNIVATIPLARALHSLGWEATFTGASVLSVLTGAAVWAALPDSTPAAAGRRSLREMRGAVGRVGLRIRSAWATPGTRLGFWVHFACMSMTTMFAVLWGQPYLVAQGYTRSAASAVLLVSVVAAVIASAPIGVVFGRFPAARVPFAISTCVLTVAGWLLLIGAFGGRPPHALVVAVVAVAAVGGPASAIGFALARDYNTPAVVGTSTGVVNVGGFVATIIASLLVGWVLDLAGTTDAHAFRLAFAAAVAVQALGTAQAIRWWLRVRAHILRAQARGEVMPVPLVRRRFDRAA